MWIIWMNKTLLFVMILLVLIIPHVTAEVDESLLKKNAGEAILKGFLDKSGITGKVSDSLKDANPEAMRDLENVCNKTSGARTLITILTFLTIAGLIYFYPAGILLGIIEILVVLNYFCWLS